MMMKYEGPKVKTEFKTEVNYKEKKYEDYA